MAAHNIPYQEKLTEACNEKEIEVFRYAIVACRPNPCQWLEAEEIDTLDEEPYDSYVVSGIEREHLWKDHMETISFFMDCYWDWDSD